MNCLLVDSLIESVYQTSENAERDMRIGRWTLLQQIGSGGNGCVWEAAGKAGEVSAIKFLHHRHLTNQKRFKRFQHEVAGLEKCKDIVGILPILDADVSPARRKGTPPPWFVLPLATPVITALGTDAQLADIVEAARCFAETLAEMHSRGVHHRDIKPENLFRYRSQWVLGDFGLVDFPGKTAVTADGERIGPMHFMAPEMLKNPNGADGQFADVYSLSKTIWVLVTQQRFPLPGPHRPDDPPYQIRSY